MVDDTVYKMDWENPDAEPELFVKGAYAVAHYADEAEGALAPFKGDVEVEIFQPGVANIHRECYGRRDVYSPYGEVFNMNDNAD